jgi:nicotinamidase/pyrazinamidase
MDALILVDIQNDFLPGGALAVPRGDEVVPVANRSSPRFELVVATQDWHPAGHGSFAASHPGRRPGEVVQLERLTQVLWPVHCVQGSAGAAFATALDVSRVERVFQKGTDPGIDSYSGFYDNGHRRSTGMGEYLRERGVKGVVVLGLATDYCVKFTALDSIQRLGLSTYVVRDGSRGVNLQKGDVDRAYEELAANKVGVCDSRELPWERCPPYGI